ncbi:MAG: DMT family transporter [Chloroflexi bacterium]|nr:DMT family transporter [Chloroflexota bacterium]MYE39538.1 DMT family transporter [Chloroflexota bacterium]
MTAIGLSFLAIMGFGSATIFARLAMTRVGPMPVTFYSLCFSFAASGILAVIFASGDFITLPLVVLAWCVMLGTFNFLGGRNLSYLAVGRIGAARAGAIVGTSAVFASILAITLTGERPHWVVLVGTVVVVGGLATALGKNIMETAGGQSAGRRVAFIGYLLAFGAACCYGTTNVVVRQLTIDYTSPLVVATISLFFGILLVAPVAAKQAVEAIGELRQSPGFMVYAALSGLAAATGVNCTYFALQRAEVVVVAPIVSANPLFTLLLAALFLQQQENVNRWLVLGIAVTVAGVALVVLGSQM